ncbi:MAG: HlyD family efflux transporter periplasmic adaptor subunit [Coriobacteriia bacterium]|nr:HlyD family efflux transporter periplasmic adaptor subunit [Coriobacteriia bacterium]
MANEKHRRPPAAAIVIVLLLAAATGGYLWWKSVRPSTDGVLTATGAVEAKEYQVASALAGRIATLSAGEGDSVKSGAVLVELDSAALQLQVDSAVQGVNAATAALTAAKNTGTAADVAAAAARLEQANAAVKLAQVQLGYAKVTAPHDGVVVSITTNVGQNASPGKTLLTLTDPSDLFVRVFVPETQIGNVKLGQAVKVVTDSTTNTYSGTVTFIASQSEFTPNNVETKDQRVKLVYEVRVRITDPSGALKAGMPTDVTFE